VEILRKVSKKSLLFFKIVGFLMLLNIKLTLLYILKSNKGKYLLILRTKNTNK